MSMNGTLYAAPSGIVRKLRDDPEEFRARLTDQVEPNHELRLRKSWHGLHFVLTGTAWEGKDPLCFLPAAPAPIPLPESIVDLRELHTIERTTLEYLVGAGKCVCRLQTPWREHLAQHFGTTYTRIALPEPYGTQP